MATTLPEALATRQTKVRRRWRIRPLILLAHVVLLVVGFFYLYPFLWMLSGSFKSLNGFFTQGLSLIPDTWRWQNYYEAWNVANFGMYFKNTVLLTVGVVVLTNLFASMAAYTLARTDIPGKRILLGIIAVTFLLPKGYTILPIFEIILRLGLNNTLWAVILVDTASGLIWFTFLYLGYMTTLSKEVEEAARIDGASFPRIYWNIAMPMAAPIVATATLFAFRGTWNDFFTPLVFTLGRPDLRTLAVGMFAFVGENSRDWTLICAGATITILPIVVVFLFLQRYFIEGIAGAVK